MEEEEGKGEENGKNLGKPRNAINCTHTHKRVSQKSSRRKKRHKNIEEIMTRNFPNFTKSMNPHIQEAQ